MASDAPTQIYLAVEIPPTAAGCAATAAALARVLDLPRARGLVSAVLLLPASGTALDARITPIVDVAQKRGAAAIVTDDARLARTLRADGVHLGPSADPLAAYAEAREILGNRFIVGVDAGTSRHDAMSLGEAGADYIGFGLGSPDPAAAQLRRDLVAWWSEIFEVPCVAFDAASPDDAADLAAAGAEFVAIRAPAPLSSEAASHWLDGLLATLARAAAPSAAQ